MFSKALDNIKADQVIVSTKGKIIGEFKINNLISSEMCFALW